MQHFIDLNNDETAESLCLYLISEMEKSHNNMHSEMADSFAQLAHIHRKQGKTKETEKALRKVLAIYESASGTQNVQFMATTLNNLAMLMAQKKNYTEARTFWQRSLALEKQQLSIGNNFAKQKRIARTLLNLVKLPERVLVYEEAENYCKQAIDIYAQHDDQLNEAKAKIRLVSTTIVRRIMHR
jgi:tetratricopeptide (TPR) repeat protein